MANKLLWQLIIVLGILYFPLGVIFELAKKYKLIMMGAGRADRIFEQMEHFPIDIIGNYGMQYATFDIRFRVNGTVLTVVDVLSAD